VLVERKRRNIANAWSIF
jgi:hypothetical protein